MRDMAKKGRHVGAKGAHVNVGATHGSAKLTEEDVRKIRAACKSGRTQRDVAEEFGIHQVNVSLIIRRKRWAHVD